MSSFIPCRSMSGLTLKRNDALRLILIEDDVTAFTPVEYRLLSVLLEKEVAEDRILIEEAFTTSAVNRSLLKNVEKHIENMRGKLRHTRLRICRLYKYGYVLVALEPASEHAATAAAS